MYSYGPYIHAHVPLYAICLMNCQWLLSWLLHVFCYQLEFRKTLEEGRAIITDL